jgi:hypothetical protein
MASAEGKRKRPLRVTIIGILSIIAGLLFLFPVLDVYGLGNLINISRQTFQAGPLLLTAFVIAMANFLIGLGCLFGWRPIWFYLVIISVINFVVALFVLLNTNIGHSETMLIGVVWLAIATYVLLSVQSKKTKAWFRR